jgi:hypothetical protein
MKRRPHKKDLFEAYEQHGKRKSQPPSEAEFRAVEGKELI